MYGQGQPPYGHPHYPGRQPYGQVPYPPGSQSAYQQPPHGHSFAGYYGQQGQEHESAPPSSPGSEDDSASRINDEIRYRETFRPPPPVKHTFEGHIYELVVAQEPQRARMCGYGDRDRRPISSPPVFQLKIKKVGESNEVDYESPEIAAMQFAALIRIYDVHGRQEKSIIKGSPTQHGISQVQLGGFTPAPAPHDMSRAAPFYSSVSMSEQASSANSSQGGAYGYGNGPFPSRTNMYPGQNPLPQPQQYAPQTSPYGAGTLPQPQPPTASATHNQSFPQSQSRPQMPPTPPAENNFASSGAIFSRNLIGATATSGLRLFDPKGKLGIYFIFNDLSVRTEDWFRLKCEVFDVAESTRTLSEPEIINKAKDNNAAPSDIQPGDPVPKRGIRSLQDMSHSFIRQHCPCLAQAFTDCFKVYSAKKFPGVADSTELSKCFAKQGVKISIRKDSEKDSKDKENKQKDNQGKRTGVKRKRCRDDPNYCEDEDEETDGQ